MDKDIAEANQQVCCLNISSSSMILFIIFLVLSKNISKNKNVILNFLCFQLDDILTNNIVDTSFVSSVVGKQMASLRNWTALHIGTSGDVDRTVGLLDKVLQATDVANSKLPDNVRNLLHCFVFQLVMRLDFFFKSFLNWLFFHVSGFC